MRAQPISLRALGALLGSLAIVSLSFSVANAHNQIVSTNPEIGGVARESPLEIRVETAENLLDLGGNQAGFAMVVTGDDGLYYGDGCVVLGERSMTTTAELGEAGGYQVTFQLISEDGHTISDQFGFTFQPQADHTPASGRLDVPVCGVEAESTAPPTTPPPTTATPEPISENLENTTTPTDSAGPGPGAMIAGAVAALVAIAATIVAFRARRSSSQ